METTFHQPPNRILALLFDEHVVFFNYHQIRGGDLIMFTAIGFIREINNFVGTIHCFIHLFLWQIPFFNTNDCFDFSSFKKFSFFLFEI